MAVDVGEHGDDALADGVRLDARQLELIGLHDVGLLDGRLALPEEPRLCVVVGELLGLAVHLVSGEGLWE
jgi:hypothetical protein